MSARVGRGALVVLGLLTGACRAGTSPIPFYRSANMTPEWLPEREATAPEMHRVGAFDAVDQNGRRITQRALAGRVTIAHFFFTRCGDVCPTTTTNLRRLLTGLAQEPAIQVLSYSVAPNADSVPALRLYARAHGITDVRWHLLTGNVAAITRLATQSYFVRVGEGATYGVARIAHTESLVLVDGDGRLRGIYAGTLPLEMDRLREDALRLEREQSGG